MNVIRSVLSLNGVQKLLNLFVTRHITEVAGDSCLVGVVGGAQRESFFDVRLNQIAKGGLATFCN